MIRFIAIILLLVGCFYKTKRTADIETKVPIYINFNSPVSEYPTNKNFHPILLSLSRPSIDRIELDYEIKNSLDQSKDLELSPKKIIFEPKHSEAVIYLMKTEKGSKANLEPLIIVLKNKKYIKAGENSSHIVTFKNRLGPELSLLKTKINTEEQNTIIEIPIAVKNSTAPISIDVKSIGGKAQENDYEILTTKVQIKKDGIFKGIQIQIKDDHYQEDEEDIILSLSSKNKKINWDSNEVQLIIAASDQDHLDQNRVPANEPDKINFQFSTKSSFVIEGMDSIVLGVYLDNPAPKDLIINIVSKGNAKKNSDFKLKKDFILIKKGESISSIYLKIIDDKIKEKQEKLSIELNIKDDLYYLSKNKHLIKIKDND